MNFKKTLVALAMAGFASGAMASDVQLDNGVWTLSAEGVQAGEVEALAPAVFDFFLDSEISASGKVAIAFDAGFDFTDAAFASGAGTVDNGTEKLVGGPLEDLKIEYGSASFTFVSYTWDQPSQTLVLTLGNGQPLLGGASFGLTDFPADTNMVDVAAVTVTSSKFDNTQIETFSKTVSQTATQFVITADQDMAGIVDAINRGKFVSGAIGAPVDADNNRYGQLKVVDLSSELKAPTKIDSMTVTLLGDFAEENDNKLAWSGAFDLSGVSGALVDQQIDKAVFTVATPAGTSAGLAHKFSYAADNDEYLVTPFKVAADLQISGFAPNKPVSYLAQQGFGSWDLEGGVINVPYLPVGFPGLSANVEISNESTEDATIYVEAFNQNGEYYARTELAQVAAGQTVTKVSAQDLINAFGLTGKNKLSVTFSFDTEGNPDDITLAPYYRQNESRINVLSDEYKGK